MSPQCSALYLSDERRCEDETTSLNGLFCSYHSRQCQGLYRGYKNRNKQLDTLNQSPPSYIATSSTALANQDFADVDSEDTLHELYDYLHLKYCLLDRVIRARKLHHSRFFSMTYDYGHQNYLDTLSNQRFIVVRALERLERRVGEVLYQKQKWFKWARQCQLDEETHRESEKKKVRKEAALFTRHMKDVQARMREMRAKEDLKRQDSYLEEAYKEKLSQEEQEAEWDPIEHVIENERGNYIDLIKHILLMTDSVQEDGEPALQALSINSAAKSAMSNASSGPKPSSKSKKSKQVSTTGNTRTELPDKSAHDTKSQVRKRLREGVKLHYGRGMHVVGTIDNPTALRDRTATVPDEEIERLLEDMAEIKHLLFCRLLLSHATVLPAAIRANSIEEFLENAEVTDTDLRDLALRMDNPGLQETRDACADLGRGDDEEEEDHYDDDTDEDEANKTVAKRGKAGLQGEHIKAPRSSRIDKWAPDREKKTQIAQQQRQSLVEQSRGSFNPPDEDKGKTLIDFGKLDDDGMFKSKKMRVKICGRYIYNYPSERAVTRGGWLQFCLIAKDSQLHDAIKLCRHWDEFFDLNILANFQYFPAANWLLWKGDRPRQQLLQMGFIPYQQFEEAASLTNRDQTGSRGHQFRRAHRFMETRNFMCANVKRNDPAMRRFLQYISMQTSQVLVLIRDAKTGRIISEPPKDELWLTREKSGLGRASKNEWISLAEIGPGFFQKMEDAREWHFGFNDYYDVYIWDLEPGQHFANLYNTVYETLVKAHRFGSLQDLYKPASSTLKTITRDPVTFWARDIKPGEDAYSIWDEIQHGRGHVLNPEGKTLVEQLATDPDASKFYNEADLLEDAVLFPEELNGGNTKALCRGKVNDLERFLNSGPDWVRFVNDMDTDEEFENTESSEEESQYLLEDGSKDKSDNDDGIDAADMVVTDKKGSGPSSNGESITGPLTIPEEFRKDMLLLSKWKPATPYGENVDGEFWTFMDREKSRAFKKSWHAGDLALGADQRRREADVLVKQMAMYQESLDSRLSWIRVLRFLDVHPHRNRRVIADICDARAMMTLFFRNKFFDSEYGILHKDSMILNQKERARNPPSRRSYASDKFKPKSFWDEWDTYWKDHKFHDYPIEWDVAVRPIIAKLYKAGIIQNTYQSLTPGRAMAVAEPGHERDFYIDLRIMTDDIKFSHEVEHPPSKEHLLMTARQFSKVHPSARFALLRLWEAPHFYPLMVGLDLRDLSSFTDALGRAWEWNFLPKDMPFSETSMHHSARLRILPYKHLLGERVLVKRNLYLVMGTNEEDLLKYATATTFVIQTEPWRLEVDLWRSFVNVDMEFLEGLQAEWLE